MILICFNVYILNLQVYLYLRNASFDSYDKDMDANCRRRYIVQPVTNTSMLLVVVNTNCGDTTSPPLSIKPEEVTYDINNTLVCQKVGANLMRKRPDSCIRSNPRESEIKDQCGLAANTTSNLLLMLLLMCTLIGRNIFLLG